MNAGRLYASLYSVRAGQGHVVVEELHVDNEGRKRYKTRTRGDIATVLVL